MNFDDIGFCIEITFENSQDIPYDTYRVDTVEKMLEIVSPKFLNELKNDYGATDARVTHIYVQGINTETGNQVDFSMGNNEPMVMTLYEGEE